nr:DsbA family protein [Aquimixticola soesokkakensis]
MNRRNALITFGFAALGGAISLTRTGSSDVTDFLITPANAQDAPAVDTDMVPDMVQGNMDAAVEVIEYASFTCPHCAAFNTTVYRQLKENYIDTGKIKFVYREIFFDKFGLWAAMIARCGGEMRYFGIADMLYEEQASWIGGGKDPMEIVSNLRTIGKKAGLSDAQLDTCMNDGEMAQAMVANFEKNATADDINATPSFVINGEKYSNMTYEDFAAILDEKLADAG